MDKRSFIKEIDLLFLKNLKKSHTGGMFFSTNECSIFVSVLLPVLRLSEEAAMIE